jgi:hypothetical protein
MITITSVEFQRHFGRYQKWTRIFGQAVNYVSGLGRHPLVS